MSPVRGSRGGTPVEKTPWKSMQLAYLGRVDQILQISTGKLSQTGGDPGEPKKEQPH